jgi:N-acetylglucosamine-6-sulfatase
MGRAGSITLLAAFALVAAAAATGHRAPPVRPNVVVFMTDDQTLEELRVMPIVRRLIGARGVTFDQSIVSFPLCCPSRATFLTGQYAHNHGVLDNKEPYGGYYAFQGQWNTLPVWLEQAGYTTMLVGRYLNRYGERSANEVPPGWDEWHGVADVTDNRYFRYELNDNGAVRRVGTAAADYSTDVLARIAVRLVRRQAGARRPFFLWLPFVAPHAGGADEGPAPVPAPLDARRFANEPLPASAAFDEADLSDKPAPLRELPRLTPAQVGDLTGYYRAELASLLAVDRAVGRVLRALSRAGVLDDTLVIFTSDNGFMHGEHRLELVKVVPYEPSIRVPLLISGPGIRRGVHVSDLVSNVDLAPTILAVTGVAPGRVQDGRSLLPLLRGSPSSAWPDRMVLLEGGPPGSVTDYAGLRSREYSYVEWADGGRELYDLRRDPDQLENVAASPAYASTVATLAARLAAARTCVGASCP